MASVNKVIIVGNLGNDPEIRTFDNGGMIATISVATSDRWTDRNTGEQREQTEWHRITFNNRLAEIARDYLKKGSSVYVEGSLHTRKWTDQQGIDRYSTEIRASSMQMLGSRPSSDGYQDNRSYGAGRGGYDSQSGYEQRNAPQKPAPQNNQAYGNNKGSDYGRGNDWPNERGTYPSNDSNSYQPSDMSQYSMPEPKPAPTPNKGANGFGSPGNVGRSGGSAPVDDDMPF